MQKKTAIDDEVLGYVCVSLFLCVYVCMCTCTCVIDLEVVKYK